MCGIFACFGSSSCDEDEVLQNLFHRGPDESGIAQTWHGKVFHTRLTILGKEDGSQPIHDNLGNLLVFNGEIYNCHELQQELGTSYRCDSRVLFDLLKKHGMKILPRLRGMFAFLFLSGPTGDIYLARDAFGMKPLFYSHDNGLSLRVSSEIRPLSPRSPGKDAFLQYLLWGNTFPGSTAYPDISEVRPAGWVRFNGELKLIEEKNWCPLGDLMRRAVGQDLHPAFKESVSRHLLADVPVGMFLSGGMDSGSIAVALSEMGNPGRVTCFSMGFDNPTLDESVQARELARHLGLDFVALKSSAGENWIEAALMAMDTPLGDPSWFPTFDLCRQAAQHTRVVLAGDGGDEVFFGYPPFEAEGWKNLSPFMVKIVMELGGLFGKTSPHRVDWREKLLRFRWGSDFPVLLRHGFYMGAVPPDWYSNEAHESYVAQLEDMAAWDGIDPGHPWESVFFYYFRMYLANALLIKTDRASMAHSLEVRCPFLDLDLFHRCFRFPKGRFPVSSRLKQPVRDYLSSRLPKRLQHFSKRGFTPPLGEIRQELIHLIFKKHGISFENPKQVDLPHLVHNLLIWLWFHPEDEVVELTRRILAGQGLEDYPKFSPSRVFNKQQDSLFQSRDFPSLHRPRSA